MKISLEWLKEYVDIGVEGEALVELLTMAGIEVESRKTVRVPDGILVCEILEADPHPSADKLKVCKVSAGEGKILQVVCGAPNARQGLKTALATIGSKLSVPGGSIEICERSLRGVQSFGMLCSAKEIGIGDDSGKIIELPQDYKPGEALSARIPSATILDLEITPNRPDLYSHFGIARDLAALLSIKAKMPKFSPPVCQESDDCSNLVKLENAALCPFYTARLIREVKVGKSPDWLIDRLEKIGLRAINNVVDATNYVLHELGQPLHAFDFAKLGGGCVVVRNAGDGEEILMLDGTKLKLKNSQLVIADSSRPLALAGIMGGEESGVSENTSDILLESAFFTASDVRRTSRETGISTDSSYRFERGVDPGMVEAASERAASLIIKIAGGKAASPLLRFGKLPEMPATFPCRHERVRKLLGLDISDKEMLSIYKRLGLNAEKKRAHCIVSPPSFRGDLKNEADLAEEVARIHGISKIPTPPVRAESGGSIRNDSYCPIEDARAQLISLGLDECVNYSLCDEASALSDANFAKENLIEISNPINRDFAFMRPSLLSGMLKSVSHNLSRKNCDLALFELGRAYCKNFGNYPEERIEACIMLTGRTHPERYSAEKNTEYDFYDIKGIVEAWLEMRKIPDFSFRPSENANFADGFCAELLVNGRGAGFLGMVSERLAAEMRLKGRLFTAILQFGPVLLATPEKIVFKALSQFPSISRDMAFLAPPEFEHGDFVGRLRKLAVKHLESVEIFDEFRDPSMSDGRRSLAYTFVYRDAAKTLTDEEVNSIHNGLRESLRKEMRIELR